MLTYGERWSIHPSHCATTSRLLAENGVGSVGEDSGIYSFENVYFSIGDNGGEIHIWKLNTPYTANIWYKSTLGYPSPIALVSGILKMLRILKEDREPTMGDTLEWIEWMQEWNEVSYENYTARGETNE